MVTMPELTKEQKERIKKFVELYKKWLQTKEGKEDREVHNEHNSFFTKKLSKANIDKINEREFRQIYKTLWASNIWTNKDWYIDNKLLKPNGLPKIKAELKKLLYGEESIGVRFDSFRENISGFGPSSLSEILHMVFPEKYCLWNEKPITVLPFLKIDILPEKFYKYALESGSDYVECIKALSLVKDELGKLGISKPNFIDLDCFFWYIFDNVDMGEDTKKESREETKPTERKIAKHISSHSEAEYYLLKLGELLGYVTHTADYSKTFENIKLGDCAQLKDIPDFAGQRDKNSAREIDVIWFDEGENPTFCLEVEHTTDITKGLNRLLQLEHFNVTFVIVAAEEQRTKFETEMNKFPYRKHKNRYKFISYDELLELYETTLNYRKMKDKLLG